ncbi:MAG: hypothetical protein ACD_11C00006G0008 [uncultured bacterium]|nr:MAG: hypothetical protein ACD_11C00006G0008 [uncultured bacterium]HBR71694.1 hypothetical protein [Candidatus Moranbacteria bacterium]
MQNKRLYLGIVAVLVVIGIFVYWGIKSAPTIEAPLAEKMNGTEESGIVYYFGKECSHCQKVEKFLQENKISEKVMFSKKEVWHDKINAQEFDEKTVECGLDKSEVGVPLLYVDKKCYIGEIEVIDFFKKEAGIK